MQCRGDGGSTDSTDVSNHASGDASSQDATTKNEAISSQHDDELGVSRTVTLMVLLTGDSDPDVKCKAESYLRAYIHLPREGGTAATTVRQ